MFLTGIYIPVTEDRKALKVVNVQSDKVADLIGAKWWEPVKVCPFRTKTKVYDDLVLFVDEEGITKSSNYFASGICNHFKSITFDPLYHCYLKGSAFLSRMDEGLLIEEAEDILANHAALHMF